jgi:hypothetical protein
MLFQVFVDIYYKYAAPSLMDLCLLFLYQWIILLPKTKVKGQNQSGSGGCQQRGLRIEMQQSVKGRKPQTNNKANGNSTKSNGNSSPVDDEATEDDEVNIDN